MRTMLSEKNLLNLLIRDIQKLGNPDKVNFLCKFFRSFPGGYGEGDKFLAVTVPDQRKIARKYYRDLSLDETEKLLHEGIHELRLTALFILVMKYQKGDSSERKKIGYIYLKNLKFVNNWDLVDSSADKILGPHIEENPNQKKILDKLVASENIWEQRVAVLTTFYFIKKHDFTDALRLIARLLNSREDLIHKATGWMLREIGSRDMRIEIDFLDKYGYRMPRTMLRYAIEKFPEDQRKKYLQTTKSG